VVAREGVASAFKKGRFQLKTYEEKGAVGGYREVHVHICRIKIRKRGDLGDSEGGQSMSFGLKLG